jgi:hypothetical protein
VLSSLNRRYEIIVAAIKLSRNIHNEESMSSHSRIVNTEFALFYSTKPANNTGTGSHQLFAAEPSRSVLASIPTSSLVGARECRS